MSRESSYQPREFTRQELFITDDSPQMGYDGSIQPQGIHFGHLKLLFSDLAAMVYFWNPDQYPRPIMVVAGGAPGNHYISILRMFPTMELHLYDSNTFIFDKPYGAQYKEEFKGRVHIHSEWFNHHTAQHWGREEYKKRGIIFTSDIRSQSHENVTPDEYYDAIVSDNRDQELWVRTIDPIFAVLKFKVPIRRLESGREDEYNTPYMGMDGYVMRGIWGRLGTTECRLIPIKKSDGTYAERVWDGIKFRDRNLAHNYTKRVPNAYKNIYTNDQTETIEGDLTNDYDSVATIFVLRDYLIKCGIESPTESQIILLYQSLIRTLQDVGGTNLTVKDLRKTGWRSTARPNDDDYVKFEAWGVDVEEDNKFIFSLRKDYGKRSGKLESLSKKKSQAPARSYKKKDNKEKDFERSERLQKASEISKKKLLGKK